MTEQPMTRMWWVREGEDPAQCPDGPVVRFEHSLSVFSDPDMVWTRAEPGMVFHIVAPKDQAAE